MDNFTFVAIAATLVFIYFIFFKNKKAAHKEMNSLSEINYKNKSSISFDDIAGNYEAKESLKELVDFIKNPDKYKDYNIRTPKGVLLYGSPGTGKTLLAQALAGEAGVDFFAVSGSDFVQVYAGLGASRIRNLFSKAKKAKRSVIFIDEIDAIGRQRGMGIGGGHDEREQTLNQILTEMDGFDVRTSVIVVAATNRPDMLDSALVRPGRFDRRISIPLPDLKDREEIIKIHMKGKPINDDVSVERLAKKTVGFSGADLENMLNEAAILTARENRDSITDKDLDEASLKVTIGSERKTLQNDEEKRMTAYHEAGHAIVAVNVKDMDAVQRVSIVARGQTLGHTDLPPERDRYQLTQTRIESLITTMLGGRAAEEVVFNEFTAGASEDIKRCTELARKMVTEYGMSPLGPIFFEGRSEFSWLAEEFGEGSSISEEMSAKIDAQISKIVDNSYKEAKKILIENREKMDKVVARLLEVETIAGEEFKEIIS